MGEEVVREWAWDGMASQTDSLNIYVNVRACGIGNEDGTQREAHFPTIS